MSRVKVCDLTQDEVRGVIEYRPGEGDLLTKQGDRINNGNMLTFHIKAKQYYLCDLAYIHLQGNISKGLKVYFRDGNRHNLRASNLYLL